MNEELVNKNRQRLARKEANYQQRNNKPQADQQAYYQGYADGKHITKKADGSVYKTSTVNNGAISKGATVTLNNGLIDQQNRVVTPVKVTASVASYLPIKYLFSKLESGQQVFYVGGHQKAAVRALAIPTSAAIWRVSLDNLGSNQFAVDIAYDDKTERYVNGKLVWSVDTTVNANYGDSVFYPRGWGFWQTLAAEGLTHFEDPTIPEPLVGSTTTTFYARPDYVYNGAYVTGSLYTIGTDSNVNPFTSNGAYQNYVLPGTLIEVSSYSSTQTFFSGLNSTSDASENTLSGLLSTYKLEKTLSFNYGVSQAYQRNKAIDGSASCIGTDTLIKVDKNGNITNFGSEDVSDPISFDPKISTYNKYFSGLHDRVVRQIIGNKAFYVSTNPSESFRNILINSTQQFTFEFELLDFSSGATQAKKVQVWPISISDYNQIWDYAHE